MVFYPVCLSVCMSVCLCYSLLWIFFNSQWKRKKQMRGSHSLRIVLYWTGCPFSAGNSLHLHADPRPKRPWLKKKTTILFSWLGNTKMRYWNFIDVEAMSGFGGITWRRTSWLKTPRWRRQIRYSNLINYINWPCIYFIHFRSYAFR